MSRSPVALEPFAFSDVQLLRLPEAAAIARLSERTLRRALRASTNRLRCFRFGRSVRISPDDLTEWLRAHADLPVVSSTIMDTVSAEAKELIQSLNRPPERRAKSGDRTANIDPGAPGNNFAPEAPTPLDCGAESSVHVPTDPRSKEEPIPMHDVSETARFWANPARTARSMR